MADAKGNICIRMSNEDVNTLRLIGNSATEQVRNATAYFRNMRKIGLVSLKNFFEEKEWLFLASCLKGTSVDYNQSFRYLSRVLQVSCEDYYNLNSDKFDINFENLDKKLKNLNPCQVEAMYSRIEDLTNKNLEINAWARF